MPLRRWSGPLTAAAILAVAWITVALMGPPAPPAGEAPKAEFSVDRAWRHIEEVGRAPHPMGTAEHDRVRAYVLAELESLGLEVDTLTALSHVRWGRGVRSALTRNLVARLPGTASTGAVLMASHYDGVPLSPAAADDAIGVATVLETARALVVGQALRNDVIFLVTDAEEVGLLGARAFAAVHPWMADVAFVTNFEARGTSGAAVMFETGPGSDWAVRELARVGRRPVASSIIPEAYARMPNDTDFSVFRDLGLPGLNFAIGGSAQWYHTPGDSPANLSPASLQHMGDNALAVVRRAGAADLAAMTGGSGDRVYFHVPGLGLMGYGPGWAVPLAVMLVAALVGAVVLAARRGRLRWWGIPVGLLAAAVAMGVSILLAHWLWGAVRDGHVEWGALHGRALYREWPYTLAVVAATAAAFTALFGLLRRWISLEGLALGALLLPVAGAVASAFLLPVASYLLLWPALAAMAMVAIVATGEAEAGDRARPGRRRNAWRLAGLGVAALVVVLFMVPPLYMVHVMLGMGVAPLLAAVTGLLVVLLLPLLDHVATPHRAWPPTAALVAAAALVAVGMAGAEPGAERPAPSNVVHVQDAATGTARWASPVGHDNAFTARFLAGSSDTARLGEFSWALRTGSYRVAPAPAWSPGAANVTVLDHREADGLRRVRFRLAWDYPPMMVEVRPAGEASRLVEPAGSAWTGGDEAAATPQAGRWRLERWGLAWPLELVVEGPAAEPVALTVSTHYQGLPPLAAGEHPVRPAGFMAVPAYRWFSTLSDVRVVRETLTP